AQQHRHVETLDLGDPVDVGVDQIGQPVQVLGPAGSSEAGPAWEGLARGRDGELGLTRASARNLRQRLLVDRAQIDEALVTRDTPAADVVVGRDRDARDVDVRAHSRRTVSRSSTVYANVKRKPLPIRTGASAMCSSCGAPKSSSVAEPSQI